MIKVKTLVKGFLPFQKMPGKLTSNGGFHLIKNPIRYRSLTRTSSYVYSRMLQVPYGHVFGRTCGYCTNSNSPPTTVIPPANAGYEKRYIHSVLETMHGFRERASSYDMAPEISDNAYSALNSLQSEDFDASDHKNLLGLLEELTKLSGAEKRDLYHSNLFWKLCEDVTASASKFSDEDFMHAMDLISQLGSWDKVPMEYLGQRGRLISEFRDQVARRAEPWFKDDLMFVMNFLSIFNTKIIPDELYSRLESEVVHMEKDDVIKLLYYVSLVKNPAPGLLQELEDKVERSFPDYGDDELAVVCLGFFKSQHVVKSEQLINEMLHRLEANSSNMNELCIVALMKCAAYSLSRDAGNQDSIRTIFQNIMKKMYPRLGDFDTSSCINMFRLAHSLRMMDHNFMDAMCQRVIRSGLGQWRLKDVSFFLFRCGSFQVMLAEKDWFYDIFMKELEGSKRRQEMIHHPRCLLQALTGLAYVGIFPYDLMNECLSPSFRKALTEKANVDPLRELIVLDQTIDIECPDYNGCRLPADVLASVQKMPNFQQNARLPHEKRRLSNRDKMLLDVQAQLEMLFNGDTVAEIAFVLPHFQTADVVLEVDEEGKVCQLPDWVDREQPCKGHKRLVLICASPNVFHIYQTDFGYSRKISGIHVMKKRQLQKLGYTVLEIPYFEWHKSNREFYLKKILKSHIDLY